ncbi:transposase family protein [Streptomyces hesseae]|uniref:Transposase family protein n=1 Tax=Streptomyces hesseae TaxID=3075519 RepID=A0ABU2SJS4_9ACTN|nr:transposase family protein [Streptomyces sp. DSM 40473]MDT0449232.1 transposase family protein [Streptomyces sp. DSM 40473]
MKKLNEPAGDTGFPVHQCCLPVSRKTNEYRAGLLRRHLKTTGSRRRRLEPGQIVVIVLAVLRHDQRIADMAGGNQTGETPIRRRRDELITLLDARAPRLDRALKRIARRGGEAVLIDGTLIPTVRRVGKDNRPNYPGKHRRHGLHLLALTDEKGHLIRISAARPGRTHDITAARHDHILEHLRATGLGALADLGFLGLDNDPDAPAVVTGYKATRTRKLTDGQKKANRVLAAAHAPRRTRLRPPQNVANPHQASHRPRPHHRPLARPADTHEPRGQPLTDDRAQTAAHDLGEHDAQRAHHPR